MKTKRILSFLVVCAVLLPLLLIAPAAQAARSGMVFDDAELLTDDEIFALNERLDAFRSDYDLDIGFVSTNGTDGKTIEAFADDFYDDSANGFAYDGLVFAIDMDSRQYCVSTCGTAINRISDVSMEAIYDAISERLADGDFSGAAITFVDAVDETLAYDAMGATSETESDAETDVDSLYEDSEDTYSSDSYVNSFHYYILLLLRIKGRQIAIAFFAVLAVALLIGGLMVRSHNKSMRSQPEAAAYHDGKGLQLSVKEDHFLRTHTSRSARPKASDDDHRSGGSSTHTSSSGREHGGGGGRSF